MRIKIFISGQQKSSRSGIGPQSWAGDDYEVSLLHFAPPSAEESIQVLKLPSRQWPLELEPRMQIKLLISGPQKFQDLKGRPATTTKPVCTTTAAEWIQVLINCRLASGSPNGRADAEKLFVSDPQNYSGPGTGPQGYHGSEYEVSLQDTSQRNQPHGQSSMDGKRGRNPHRPMKNGGSSRSYPIFIVCAWACYLLLVPFAALACLLLEFAHILLHPL
jgi:hypothetical protein